MKTIKVPGPRTMRWTVDQYDRLSQLGFFRGGRVELIEGRIIKMPPQKEPHVLGVTLAYRALMRAFDDQKYYVRPPAPLRQGKLSKPEPDVAVVAGTPRDYALRDNPSQALLVVEVSDSTLRLDRGRKASLYAKFGIADYWIVNVVDRQVEVYRNPIADPSHRWGFRYSSVEFLKPPASVRPLAVPQASIPVADLLP